jgi:hypothetical protein
MLAVVPVAGVVAGVAITAHGGSTPAGQAAAGPSPSATVQTDAYIVHRIEATLATANNYIIESSATSGPGQVTTTYLDSATGTTRSVVAGGDKVTYWIQVRVSGDEDHWQMTYVDYTTRTWWARASHSAALGKDTSDLPVLNVQTTPAEVSRALSLGELRVAVKGKVNGRAAVELVYAGKLAGKADAVHYWVDGKTYQPVQMDLPPFTAASTINESWIPKSAANVAQTNKPQVPAGFRQVPPSSAFNG